MAIDSMLKSSCSRLITNCFSFDVFEEIDWFGHWGMHRVYLARRLLFCFLIGFFLFSFNTILPKGSELLVVGL